MSWFSGWVDVMFILLLYLNDIHDTTSNQEYDSWQMLYINMHYMLYMYIYIYTYTIHLCGDKTYDCIFCHRFTDWIRDKHQQVLPCSVLSIPSMVWGALAHLISFSDEQLNSLFKSVMHGQIYTDPICIYNIYTHIILALFCKKDLETWTFVLADCRSASYSVCHNIRITIFHVVDANELWEARLVIVHVFRSQYRTGSCLWQRWGTWARKKP